MFRLTSKSRVYAIFDVLFISADGLSKRINDMTQVSNIIVTVGDNMLEAYKLENGIITLGPNVTFDSSSIGEVLCIVYHPNSSVFFCGHKDGNISAWKPAGEFIACNESSKIHDGVSEGYLYLRQLIGCRSSITTI
jgi:hypothetical protein